MGKVPFSERVGFSGERGEQKSGGAFWGLCEGPWVPQVGWGLCPPHAPLHTPLRKQLREGRCPPWSPFWDSGLICLAPKSLLSHCPINLGQASPSSPGQECGWLRRGEAATNPPSLLCLHPKPDNPYSGCYPTPPRLSDPGQPPLLPAAVLSLHVAQGHLTSCPRNLPLSFLPQALGTPCSRL